ncbi:MAG: hypothetical protein JXB14_02185 [Candidatus Altiarchaeota archaeon]|nr:hypothetical protein [Candidatus Altiarchaeota archaeon]
MAKKRGWSVIEGYVTRFIPEWPKKQTWSYDQLKWLIESNQRYYVQQWEVLIGMLVEKDIIKGSEFERRMRKTVRRDQKEDGFYVTALKAIWEPDKKPEKGDDIIIPPV